MRNKVLAAAAVSDRKLVLNFAADHKAGDLVFEDGYFGFAEEDVKAGQKGYILIGGLFRHDRIAAAPIAGGAALYALPTSVATTLALQTTTAGTHFPVGRAYATSIQAGGATYVKVHLFTPRPL